MFKKLISNLPFNPSLVSQVSFYTKRIQQEASVRRMGFGLIALAMFIQMFAVIAPPERSLAASDNHIINGLRTKRDILAAWDRTGSDIPAIYGKFGLTRADINSLPMNPNTTIKSNSGPDYWTIGRNSLSNYSNVNYLYKLSEVALTVSPSTTIYMRQLSAWDIQNPFNTYSAFTGIKADGTRFWILVDCGNYTQEGKFTLKEPKMEFRKTVVGNPATLKPGDNFTFRFEYRNGVQDSLARNVILADTLDLANYDIISPSNLTLRDNILRFPLYDIGYTPNFNVLDITVRLKNPFPGVTGKTCNVAMLESANSLGIPGGPACVNVVTPCTYNPALAANDPACKPPVPPKKPCTFDPNLNEGDAACEAPKLVCSLIDTDLNKSTRVATFKTTVETTNAKSTKIISYGYDFGDKKTDTILSNTLTNTTKHTYAAGIYDAKVTVNYTVNGDVTQTAKKVECSAPISFEADKPFGTMKKVKNITQNLEGDKALNSKVNAGDVIEYTLITTNTQDYSRKNYIVSDYVGDLMDYSEIDAPFLASQGGAFDLANKKITFNIADIAARTDVAKTFKIKLKNPIPATNSPSNVSGTFDCKISNKYGNELTMNIACPAVKGIETIPNTGPGTSLIFGFMITAIVGYFYARSRIMAKELQILRAEFAPSGGF